jgi:hypothetical protein
MRRDLGTLSWLRWKQFQDGAVYWMRILGYQSTGRSWSGRIYLLYLLGIGAIWLGTVGSWVFDQANALGKLITPDSLAGILIVIPPLVLIGQVYVLVTAMRGTPLKLSFADMAYIASSPVNPAAPVVFAFFRQVVTRIVLLVTILSIFFVLLARPLGEAFVLSAVLRAIGTTTVVIVFTWALAWLLGILRLVYPQVRRWRYLWAAPIALLLVAYVLPDVVYWPGNTVILYLYGTAPTWLLPFLVIVAAGLIYLLIRISQRIDMVQVADESILFARIQALGLMAWRNFDVQLRIRMQATQATRKPFLRLPTITGFWGLAAKAGLSYIRHPFMLLFSLLWGAAITQAAVLIIANSLPVQLWILWLLIIAITPPIGILYVFKVDVAERFLRQFLPVNGFELLIADILAPLACVMIGSLGIWLLQQFNGEITTYGLTMIPILGTLLALCGAYSLTSTRVLQTRILTTVASFGAIMFAGANFHSPFAATIVAVLAVLILIGLVSTNA